MHNKFSKMSPINFKMMIHLPYLQACFLNQPASAQNKPI